MSLFSERNGFTKKREIFQDKELDVRTKNILWSLYHSAFLAKPLLVSGYFHKDDKYIRPFLSKAWVFHFHQTIDTFDYKWDITYEYFKNHFFSCNWYDLYNFLEYSVRSYPNRIAVEKFIASANNIFETELVAFRFINNQITPITAEEEVASISSAINSGNEGVKLHLSKAVEMLSARPTPDFRNSVKESISAVEAIAKLIANDDKATLGEALDKINANGELHNAFIKSLKIL